MKVHNELRSSFINPDMYDGDWFLAHESVYRYVAVHDDVAMFISLTANYIAAYLNRLKPGVGTVKAGIVERYRFFDRFTDYKII